MTARRRLIALGLASTLALAACADGADTTAPAASTTPAPSAEAGPGTTAMATEPTATATATEATAMATEPAATVATDRVETEADPDVDAGAPTPASRRTTSPDGSHTATATSTSPSVPAAGDTPTVPTSGASAGSEPIATEITLEPIVADPALLAVLDRIPGWLADPSTVPETAFAPAFLAEVPIGDVRSGLESLGGGSWTVSDVQAITSRYATAIVTGPNGSLLADVEIDADGGIVRVFFENAGLREPPASMAALVEQLSAAGERTGLVVAEVTDGACTPTTDVRADEVLPIASAFKLYVLGAVAAAIADGTVTWEQPVTIRPELRSPWVPLDVADGDTMTVRDLAQLMIEVSDNTAADHLIDLVGRDAVEATLTTFGHHDPSITRPLLTTREMAVLKTTPELLARYADADEPARRELLAGEVAAAPTPGDADVWRDPRAVFEVEWFATPNDLCRALAALQALSTQPGLEPITEIMTTNPGVVTDPARIASLWFKGGSEPGVLVGAWLAERIDGSWFVVAGGAASTRAPVDPVVIELVGAAVNLG